MRRPSRARATVTGAAALVGLLLFAWTLSRTGAADALGSVARIGFGGFAAILVLSGLRLAIRSAAWMRCVDPPSRLAFRDALSATLAGEALTALTPLANIVGEPAKALFVRRRVAPAAALSAIVVENIFYAASVAVMIGLGTAVFLLRFRPDDPLRWAAYAAIVGVVAILAAVFALLAAGVQPATRAIGWLHDRGAAPPSLASRQATVQAFEAGINRFSGRNRRRLPALLLLETCFHIASITEVYVTLHFVGGPLAPSLVNALVLDSAGRAITVAFRFIPLRLGVDEAGNALMAHALQLGASVGVAVALLRKARVLVWTGVGVAVMLQRGLSPRRALIEAQQAD